MMIESDGTGKVTTSVLTLFRLRGFCPWQESVPKTVTLAAC